MSEKPEALRLIQHMDYEYPEDWDGKAIRAELLRQHAKNERLREALRVCLAHWLKDDNPDELQENVAKFKELCGWEDKT